MTTATEPERGASGQPPIEQEGAFELERHDLLGVPVAHMSDDEFLRWAIEAAATPRPQTCFGVNPHSMTVASTNAEYAAALESCDAVMCDGVGIQIAARMLGGPIPERQIITDYHDAIHADVAAKGGAVFIIGYEDGVAAEAVAAVHGRHPNLRAVGSYHGFFETDEEDAVVAAIQQCRPSVLWVGMGNPRQELFVMRNLERLAVPLVITCGAMWKYELGTMRRAPQLVQRFGLEWLYRCVTQGAKVWGRYTVGNVQFLRMVVAERLRVRR